jgi:hypothetical protein
LPKFRVTKDLADDYESFSKTIDLSDETQLAELEADLRQYETRFRMSTSDFVKRYKAGRLADEYDFHVWAGKYEIYALLRSKKPTRGAR